MSSWGADFNLPPAGAKHRAGRGGSELIPDHSVLCPSRSHCNYMARRRVLFGQWWGEGYDVS